MKVYDNTSPCSNDKTKHGQRRKPKWQELYVLSRIYWIREILENKCCPTVCNENSTHCLSDPQRRCDETSWCWGLKQKTHHLVYVTLHRKVIYYTAYSRTYQFTTQRSQVSAYVNMKHSKIHGSQISKHGVFISAAMSSASNGNHVKFSRFIRFCSVRELLFVTRNHAIWKSRLDKPKIWFLLLHGWQRFREACCLHLVPVYGDISPYQRGVATTLSRVCKAQGLTDIGGPRPIATNYRHSHNYAISSYTISHLRNFR